MFKRMPSWKMTTKRWASKGFLLSTLDRLNVKHKVFFVDNGEHVILFSEAEDSEDKDRMMEILNYIDLNSDIHFDCGLRVDNKVGYFGIEVKSVADILKQDMSNKYLDFYKVHDMLRLISCRDKWEYVQFYSFFCGDEDELMIPIKGLARWLETSSN